MNIEHGYIAIYLNDLKPEIKEEILRIRGNHHDCYVDFPIAKLILWED